MTANEMTERIVTIVSERDYVSFAELMEICGPEAKGDLTLELKENLVLWSGVSQLFDEAFKAALHRIQPMVTTPMTYLIDGEALKLPIAKRIRAYKKGHWLPVTFRLKGRA